MGLDIVVTRPLGQKTVSITAAKTGLAISHIHKHITPPQRMLHCTESVSTTNVEILIPGVRRNPGATLQACLLDTSSATRYHIVNGQQSLCSTFKTMKQYI